MASTESTHSRDDAASRWMEQVAHYFRGSIRIHVTGSEGGEGEVVITEDGRILRSPSGVDITSSFEPDTR